MIDNGEEKQILASVEHQLYIEIDRETKVLYASDYLLGDVFYSTKGRLTTVNAALGAEIEEYFQIELLEYGVSVFNETISMSITVRVDDGV